MEKKNSHNECEKSSIIEGEVSIGIEIGDEKKATIVLNALKAELINPPTYRSRAQVETDGRLIKIKIFSRDLVSLRAAVNSYMKWLSTILGALEVLEGEFGGYKKSPGSATTGNNA